MAIELGIGGRFEGRERSYKNKTLEKFAVCSSNCKGLPETFRAQGVALNGRGVCILGRRETVDLVGPNKVGRKAMPALWCTEMIVDER
jgi:hypothetical protein